MLTGPSLIPAGWTRSRLAGEMLKRYLLDQAHQQFAARRQAVAAIKTPADIAKRQKAMRSFLLRSLGDVPDRTPLNPKSFARSLATAIALKTSSSRAGPITMSRPICICPRANRRSRGCSCRAVTATMARHTKAIKGYASCWPGTAWRCSAMTRSAKASGISCWTLKGKPVVRGTTEHTMAGIGALLVGRQLGGLSDLGWLPCSRLSGKPARNRSRRLGCTGNSGGGTMTAYLMALDDRIAVAAPSCFITSLERLFATIGPQDAEQNITGISPPEWNTPTT